MNWQTIDFIKDFENLYEVSDTGLIRRKDSKRELKLTMNKDGYYTVHFSNKAKRKRLRVSRLVAQSFIKNPDNKPEVDHIDTVRTNNNVSNLKWASHNENVKNPITLQKYSDVHNGNKHNDRNYRKNILALREDGMSYKSIAKTLNCSISTVHYHIKGQGNENN